LIPWGNGQDGAVPCCCWLMAMVVQLLLLLLLLLLGCVLTAQRR
jgi:hypothetical protein